MKTQYTLPESWAPVLFYGDYNDMPDEDADEINAWMGQHKGEYAISRSEHPEYTSLHDAPKDMAHMCLDFTFIKED